MNEIPETTRRRIRELLPNIRNKRARIVIEHILAHGHITTEDLEHYGYKHPPRAARDVREAGIPLVTFRVKSADGSRSIAAVCRVPSRAKPPQTTPPASCCFAARAIAPSPGHASTARIGKKNAPNPARHVIGVRRKTTRISPSNRCGVWTCNLAERKKWRCTKT